MNSSLIDVLHASRANGHFQPDLSGGLLNRPGDGDRSARRLPIHFGGFSNRTAQEVLAHSRIRQTYDFEGLLVSIMASFINLPTQDIDKEIGHALEQVCSLLGLDRAGFWLRSADDPCSFQLRHQWATRGHLPGKELQDAELATSLGLDDRAGGRYEMPLGTISKTCLPWITEQAKRGKGTMFSRLEELPPEAAQDKLALEGFGTKSSVVIPLLAQNQPLGVISFDRIRSEGAWPQLLQRRLELVAEIFADVTARTIIDEAAKLALRKVADLTTALDAHAIVAIADLQGRITSVNRKFCSISKYSREELLGKDHRIVNSGLHSKEFFQQLWSTISRGDVWQGEIRDQARDGSFYWVATTIVPLLDEGGRPRQYVEICADITEKKLAEEALTKSYGEIKELKEHLQAESDFFKSEIKVGQAHGAIIGRSEALKTVLHQVEQVAPADCSVLINGETGTGKELIAQEIHRLSSRKDRPMILVNCAALPSALVESELFGRERGAYTGALTSQVGRFEVANGSTIFLDEVGELSLEVQAKLLRVLQQGEFQRLGSPRTHKVNVRVIAATNRDLAAEVRKGKFREDLYYRLRVFPIELPPLRERIEDIPLLVFSFMEEFSLRMGKKITKLPRKGMEALQRHSWPGNIRELRNVIEHSVILSTGDTLKLSFLGESPIRDAQAVTLAEAEREHILKTLESTGWRIKGPHGAAQRLDLQPSTLYSRMQKLGIPHRRQKDELAGED